MTLLLAMPFLFCNTSLDDPSSTIILQTTFNYVIFTKKIDYSLFNLGGTEQQGAVFFA